MQRIRCGSLIFASWVIGARVLSAQGSAVEGRLGADLGSRVGGRFVAVYSITSTRVNALRGVALASPDFDAYLVLVAPDRSVIVDHDANVRVRVRTPRTGRWQVVVTSVGPPGSGRFALWVDGPRPQPASVRSLPPAALDSITRRLHASMPRAAIRREPPAQALPRADTATAAYRTDTSTSAAAPVDTQRTSFTWPPPQASAMLDIPVASLRRAEGPFTNLGAISDALERALIANGYSERTFYSIPHGFAIVTRLEQIDDLGHSLTGSDRWVTDHAALPDFTIGGYLRALLHGTQGHFRVIVFGVTAEPFKQTADSVTRSEALGWLRGGLNSLPPAVRDIPFDDRVQLTALVYEFEISATGDVPSFAIPGRLSGLEHLTNAGILSQLQR